ncbi:hypothetical protein D0T12_18355 [Actinomadura spongiicola]|uniref:Uncharacterized protein n=1 Tax=Actinomadura spongiicola TaxID=2303421 RepID=A0A372GG06_9ACTN|nr:hypothetical protein [Actinomadura spongiicola]RFS84122.1 hypothetical protein D0T12_18355 [Actinomadura spongiicola]
MNGPPARLPSDLTDRMPATGPEPVAAFYVSVRTSARMGESSLVLGPFADRGTAHAHVPLVREFVAARHRGGEWWRFSVVQVTAPPDQALPMGTLNALIPAAGDGLAA